MREKGGRGEGSLGNGNKSRRWLASGGRGGWKGRKGIRIVVSNAMLARRKGEETKKREAGEGSKREDGRRKGRRRGKRGRESS